MRDNYNYDSIFHSYTKYRPATFNNILAYDNSIFKFKERIRGFNKIQREMEIKLSKKIGGNIELKYLLKKIIKKRYIQINHKVTMIQQNQKEKKNQKNN